MGYRSDVVVILSDTAYAKFHVLYPDLFSNLEDLLVTRPVEEIVQSDKSRIWFLVSEHIKWYDSYDEVQQFERFLDELDPEDFKFVRIGEEYEDIEIKGDLDPSDGPVYVNRHIVTPWENV